MRPWASKMPTPGDREGHTVLDGLGLRVEQASRDPQPRASGCVAQVEAAFQPGLARYRNAEQGEFRGREGVLHIPAELDGLITGVFGLDERRVARRRHRVTPLDAEGLLSPAAAKPPAAPAQPLSPAQLAAHYRFPPGDGAGQTVAIAEFGGGYFAADLSMFCAKQGTARTNGHTARRQREVGDDVSRRSSAPQQRVRADRGHVEVNMDSDPRPAGVVDPVVTSRARDRDGSSCPPTDPSSLAAP